MDTRTALVSLLLAAGTAGASAAPPAPRTVAFTGLLRTSSGSPEPNGQCTVRLSLYPTTSGGTALWTETKSVSVAGGLFSTALGDTQPISPTVNFNTALFVGVSAGPDANHLDAEMVPRLALQAAPYAILAESVADNSVPAGGLASDAASLNKVSGGAMTQAGANVGIGTANPTSVLDVRGDIAMGATGQLQAAASDQKLRIVEGLVQFPGGVPTVVQGSGFAVSVSNGHLKITFDTPFSDSPAIAITPAGSDTNGVSAQFLGLTPSFVNVTITAAGSGAVQLPFTFLAIGPR